MTVARQLGWTALVVTTSAAQQAARGDVLEEAGYAVTCADSFARACSRLTTERPDILITDLRLGAYNGLHLVWEQSFRRPEAPAVVICDPADAVLKSDARDLNCRFLVKPVHPVTLVDVVGARVSASHLVSARHLQNHYDGVGSLRKVTA